MRAYIRLMRSREVERGIETVSSKARTVMQISSFILNHLAHDYVGNYQKKTL